MHSCAGKIQISDLGDSFYIYLFWGDAEYDSQVHFFMSRKVYICLAQCNDIPTEYFDVQYLHAAKTEPYMKMLRIS